MSELNDTDEWVYTPLCPTALDAPGWRPAQLGLDAFGLSHPGHVRPDNQDRFLIAQFGRHFHAIQSNLASGDALRHEITGHGLLVADGLGGQAAGDVASNSAINALFNLVVDTPDWIFRLDDPQLSAEIKRRGVQRMEQICQAMTEQAQADPELRGFGTTLTTAWGIGEHWFIAHLGDSRAYLFRGGELTQLTRDHTAAQEMVDAGVLDEERAREHRLRHRLTRLLGDNVDGVDPDIQRLVVADNDILLLCSDGLTEMVSDEGVAEILAAGHGAPETCQQLVDAALAAGGRDNVTVVIARIQLA